LAIVVSQAEMLRLSAEYATHFDKFMRFLCGAGSLIRLSGSALTLAKAGRPGCGVFALPVDRLHIRH